MTANSNPIDLAALLETHLQQAEPDPLRSMLASFVQALTSADVDAVCGAQYQSRSEDRVTRVTATGPGGAPRARHVNQPLDIT